MGEWALLWCEDPRSSEGIDWAQGSEDGKTGLIVGRTQAINEARGDETRTLTTPGPQSKQEGEGEPSVVCREAP